jgi:hypothetical protein
MGPLAFPPTGGHDKLRLVRPPAGTHWYRIVHRRFGSALHFTQGTDARWNDPHGRFGVLYLADAPDTAFAETFGRLVPDTHAPAADKLVTLQELEERHLHRVSAGRELALAQLLGTGLATLNLDARLLATVDYALPQAWSHWVHEGPARADGLVWQSRLLTDRVCTGLYDRARTALADQDLGPLDRWHCPDTGRTVIDILDDQGWGLI